MQMKETRLMRDLCFSGRIAAAVELLCSCGTKYDPKTCAFLLQETINRKESKLGRRIHAHMIITGFVPDQYLTTKLLIFYAKDGDLDSAHQLFDRMPHPSSVPWNAMISGHVQRGLEKQGLDLYYLITLYGAKLLASCSAISCASLLIQLDWLNFSDSDIILSLLPDLVHMNF